MEYQGDQNRSEIRFWPWIEDATMQSKICTWTGTRGYELSGEKGSKNCSNGGVGKGLCKIFVWTYTGRADVRQSHWVLHLCRKKFSRVWYSNWEWEVEHDRNIKIRKVNEVDDQMITAVGTMDGPDVLWLFSNKFFMCQDIHSELSTISSCRFLLFF